MLKHKLIGKSRRIVSSLFVFGLIGLLIFLAVRPVGAVSIASSDDSRAGLSETYRKIVTASDGAIFAAYNTSTLVGSETHTGIVYRTSTDGGSTWSGSTQIDNITVAGCDFSVAINPVDNSIFVAYDNSQALDLKILSYSGSGVWS